MDSIDYVIIIIIIRIIIIIIIIDSNSLNIWYWGPRISAYAHPLDGELDF